MAHTTQHPQENIKSLPMRCRNTRPYKEVLMRVRRDTGVKNFKGTTPHATSATADRGM